MDRKAYLVFDVESVGLHGDGFAVGYVVLDAEGTEIDNGLYWTDPTGLHGTPEGHAWVQANCGPFDRPPCVSVHEVRTSFWRAWQFHHIAYDAILVADCAWPVEARFLAACVDDAPALREWQGPYPLHDVATARLMVGLDPLATEERRPNELPAHNPLADARQSARLWVEAMQAREKQTHGS